VHGYRYIRETRKQKVCDTEPREASECLASKDDIPASLHFHVPSSYDRVPRATGVILKLEF
jgi:hypothetical protein